MAVFRLVTVLTVALLAGNGSLGKSIDLHTGEQEPVYKRQPIALSSEDIITEESTTTEPWLSTTDEPGTSSLPPSSQPPSSSTGGDWSQCSDGSDQIAPPDCPPETGIPSYFPFPYDCAQYFECSNGAAICHRCAPGTIWDQQLQTCNHPGAVNCTIVTTLPPTASTAKLIF